MNRNSISTIGFMFKSSKVIIKCDEESDHATCSCKSSSCEWCNYCDRNLVSVFKLTKEDFITSSLEIATSNEEQWVLLKKNISDFYNKAFIVSLTKDGNYNSFFSKLINCKECDCCDSIFLFFKYNLIANFFNPCIPSVIDPCNNNQICHSGDTTSIVTSLANLTYNLEEGVYRDVKFYYNPNDVNGSSSCCQTSCCSK